MISRVRKKLTYSNVIASLALFVALGGAAVAAGLPNNSVGAKKLKNGAVTTKKLRKEAVTNLKLRADAVSGSKIAGGSVGGGDLANNAVSASKIANNAVTNSKIANGVVGTNKLGNEVVTTAKLAKEDVTTEKLKNGSVTSAKLGSDVGPFAGSNLRSGQTLRGQFAVGGAGGAPIWAAQSFAFPLAGGAESRSDRPGHGDDGQLPRDHRGHRPEPQRGGRLPLPLRDQQGQPRRRRAGRPRRRPDPARLRDRREGGSGRQLLRLRAVGGDGALGARRTAGAQPSSAEHRVGHLARPDRGLPLAGQVRGAEAALEDGVDRRLDPRRVVGAAEAVAEHHRRREEGRERVGDALRRRCRGRSRGPARRGRGRRRRRGWPRAASPASR